MPLFLLLLISLPSIAATTPSPEQAFWSAKGEYFRALLGRGDSTTAAALARFEEKCRARTDAAIQSARAGKIPQLEKRKAYTPAHGFHLDELDMLERSKELKDSEKAELAKIFRASAARLQALRREKVAALKKLAKNPRHPEGEISQVRATFEEEAREARKAVEETARILTHSAIDRDYAIRAFLREHRRLGIYEPGETGTAQ